MSFLESKNAFDEAQGTAIMGGGGLYTIFKRTSYL